MGGTRHGRHSAYHQVSCIPPQISPPFPRGVPLSLLSLPRGLWLVAEWGPLVESGAQLLPQRELIQPVRDAWKCGRDRCEMKPPPSLGDASFHSLFWDHGRRGVQGDEAAQGKAGAVTAPPGRARQGRGECKGEAAPHQGQVCGRGEACVQGRQGLSF